MFEKGKTNIRDYMLFIKYFLDEQTLMQCAKYSNISTAVKWAQNTRNSLMEYYHVTKKKIQIAGKIEKMNHYSA